MIEIKPQLSIYLYNLLLINIQIETKIKALTKQNTARGIILLCAQKIFCN